MVGVGGTGWLLGPFVGEGVFRAVYRREWGLMSVVCSVPLFQSFFPSSDYPREGRRGTECEDDDPSDINANGHVVSPTERKGFLRPHPEIPRRPFPGLVFKPPAGLLRREDRERHGFPDLDAGSAGV